MFRLREGIFHFILLLFSNGALQTSAYLFPLAARLPIPGTPSPPGSPWPLPQEWIQNPERITVSSNEKYEYSTTAPNCKILQHAIETRFSFEKLFNEGEAIPDKGFPILSKLQVNIPPGEENQCNVYPKLEQNKQHESYNISIRVNDEEGIATISAFTIWGALHGLETFSELIWKRNSGYYLNVTEISDWPRYPHRGVMIDTARHYISPDIILQILTGMSYNKLNVLHWHIVDDQSFPFVSQTFPELSEKGAYIPGVLIYDQETVQEVIEEARNLGIRVVLEFDTPGHTLSWGLSHPELLTPCYGDGVNPGTPNYTNHAPYEIIDPTKENTYAFMKSLFTEVFNVSKDVYLHLGMDEVYYACWKSSPKIKEFMMEHGYTDESEVQQYYTRRLLQIIKDIGARSIVWQDPLDFGVELESDVIVQVWKGDETDPWETHFQNALDKGYNVLLSSPFYLNYISYGEIWKKYYESDPVLNLENITESQERLILGGEAALWAEYVDNTNIIQRLFPFVGAVAERFWSAPNSSTTDDAKWRLDQHRCRMLGRGLAAQPIFNGYCFESERRKPEPDNQNDSTGRIITDNIVLWVCFAALFLSLIRTARV